VRQLYARHLPPTFCWASFGRAYPALQSKPLRSTPNLMTTNHAAVHRSHVNHGISVESMKMNSHRTSMAGTLSEINSTGNIGCHFAN
jgi:hypothetical protein